MSLRTGGGDPASAERPARMFERREAERMLRLYTRLWKPRNVGSGRPRTWPTDLVLAQATTDWRANLGLSPTPLPAPVVSGSGPDCYACVLAGLWSGEGAPPTGAEGGGRHLPAVPAHRCAARTAGHGRRPARPQRPRRSPQARGRAATGRALCAAGLLARVRPGDGARAMLKHLLKLVQRAHG